MTKLTPVPVWIGVSRGGVLYARTAAADKATCRVWCAGYSRAKLTPIRGMFVPDAPRKKKAKS